MTDQIETASQDTPEGSAAEANAPVEPAAPAAEKTVSAPTDVATKSEYQVLARKYRPKTFEELIGHGPMVKTLSNALESGRLAHAFVLTGVRGIGKTTTARIIARALNCIGRIVIKR